MKLVLELCGLGLWMLNGLMKRCLMIFCWLCCCCLVFFGGVDGYLSEFILLEQKVSV